MFVNFLSAMALVFVIEGVLPFASPERWKRLIKQIQNKEDKALRIMGFSSMVFGVILLTLIHQFVD